MRLLSANFFMAIVLIAAMPSCAQKITRPTADRYSLNIIDDIEARRFNLSLNSIDNRALCVSIENWPDSLGHFMVENNDVSLRIGQSIGLNQMTRYEASFLMMCSMIPKRLPQSVKKYSTSR
jgi:hypothetical protein